MYIQSIHCHWILLFTACLDYSLTLNMEAVCFSETSVNFYWTAWRHISEDITNPGGVTFVCDGTTTQLASSPTKHKQPCAIQFHVWYTIHVFTWK